VLIWTFLADRTTVLAHEVPITRNAPSASTGIGATSPCAQSNLSVPCVASRTSPT
jgi:hypothetical protein